MLTSTDLQRQVAQEIMGWTACRVRAGLLFGYLPESTGEEHELEEVPAYADDLLDAWTVVEEIHRSGYSCEVSISSALATPMARFAKGKLCTFECDSSTVPEALPEALAALCRKRPSDTSNQDGEPRCEVFQALKTHGHVIERVEPGKWALLCPWYKEHSKETSKTAAVY